ncbi:MAG: hypothetical protein O8C66_06340 [Candidatus Methanoperedens sp.]|nr:hypothetical protein [Candidatus Methanoperedens sp.]MCZ7370110.1 hypothetical protein [Candidatus Methanoperedens sp.]
MTAEGVIVFDVVRDLSNIQQTADKRRFVALQKREMHITKNYMQFSVI